MLAMDEGALFKLVLPEIKTGAPFSAGSRELLKEKSKSVDTRVYYLKKASISHLWRLLSLLLQYPSEKHLNSAFAVIQKFFDCEETVL